MKTDKLFYDLVRELPQIFFDLIGKPETNPNIYTFTEAQAAKKDFPHLTEAETIKKYFPHLDVLLSTIKGHNTKPMYFVTFQSCKEDTFYESFFKEIMLYFRRYSPPNTEWYAVVIYDSKLDETSPHPRYKAMVDNHLHRIYLKELPSDESLAKGIARLFVETPQNTGALVQQLMTKAQQEISDETKQTKVLKFIQSVVANKFLEFSKQEVGAMFRTDDTKKTGYNKSAKEEVYSEAVQRLLKKGRSIEEIAESLDLKVEEVRKWAKNQP